mgnify:CR=1 FL=1
MKGTFTITTSYDWWRNDGGPTDPRHIPALRRRAEELITHQLKNGNREGELTHWTTSDDESQDGIYYRGWWKRMTIQENES